MFKGNYSNILISVVSQDYELDVFKTNILLHNDALVGCVVPSHVGDMLEVQGWVDSEGVELGAGLGRKQFGNKLVNEFMIYCCI